MSTESAEKKDPSELDLFCYGLYLRAVSGDQYPAETLPKETLSASTDRVRALYAIAQGTMLNRRTSPQGAYATESDLALMSCRQLSEETTRALQWIA